MFCSFESGSCDFDLGGSGNFNFTVVTGEESAPDIYEDHNYNAKGHFLYAVAEAGNYKSLLYEIFILISMIMIILFNSFLIRSVFYHLDSATESFAYLRTTMLTGAEHVVECFHFWFYIDGTIGEVTVWLP